MLLEARGAAAVVTATQVRARTSAALAATSRHATTCTRLLLPCDDRRVTLYDLWCVGQYKH